MGLKTMLYIEANCRQCKTVTLQLAGILGGTGAAYQVLEAREIKAVESGE